MMQCSGSKLLLRLENWRLRQHFKRVETILHAQDVSHLSPVQRQSREQYLDRLHHYAKHGVFPRNYEHPPYSPCFIDRDGRECAVAHLVMMSGQAELAHHIADVANYAYVPQMTFPELDDWAVEAGLTKGELTLIQPGYYTQVVELLLCIAIPAWIAGFMTLLTNGVYIVRKQEGHIRPVIGLSIALILLFLGIVYGLSMTTAYEFGTHLDIPPRLTQVALQEVTPLALGAAISLILAFATGGLSLYRIWYFNRAKSADNF